MSFVTRKRKLNHEAVLRNNPFIVRAGILEAYALMVCPSCANIAYVHVIITPWELPNGIFEDTAVILMRKHPFLRARFTALNGEGFLEEMAQLVSPVAQSKNKNWEAELEEQLLQPYQ